MPKIETRTRKTTDALKILDRMMGDDASLRQQADEALVNAEVAQLIYEVRTKAKLTQKELAELIGTTQSVIARLEDADYEGHSLSMLQRIASALNKRVEIRFVPASRRIAA
jgi:ribosome-binding protein aMBF1 (putative translation factor)